MNAATSIADFLGRNLAPLLGLVLVVVLMWLAVGWFAGVGVLIAALPAIGWAAWAAREVA